MFVDCWSAPIVNPTYENKIICLFTLTCYAHPLAMRWHGNISKKTIPSFARIFCPVVVWARWQTILPTICIQTNRKPNSNNFLMITLTLAFRSPIPTKPKRLLSEISNGPTVIDDQCSTGYIRKAIRHHHKCSHKLKNAM